MHPPTNNFRQRRTEPNRTSQHGFQNVRADNRTNQKAKKMSNTDPTKNPKKTEDVRKR